jgi:hypothetical protein
MKHKIYAMTIGILIAGLSTFAQNKNLYEIKHSEEFEGVPGLKASTYPFNNGNILISYSNGENLKKVGLQIFSSDLKQLASTVPDVKAMFDHPRTYFIFFTQIISIILL